MFLKYYEALFSKKTPVSDSQSLSNAPNDTNYFCTIGLNESSKVSLIKNKDQNNNLRIDNVVIKKNNLNSTANDQQEIKILKYEIIRIEPLPNSFNQIKVYATVDSISTSDGMLFLCEKLKEEHRIYQYNYLSLR